MGDWKGNYPRRGNEGAPGETPSDWYRRKIDEMTLHEQFVDLWDKQREHRQPAPTQPLPAPWEGIAQVAQSLGINLGELWKTREEELKAARDAADTTNRELHELRLREIDRRVQELQAIADKVEQKTQNPQETQGQKSFLEKLDEVTEGLVSRRIASMLSGDNTQEPRDPVDEVIDRLDQADKLKQRFGNPGGGVQALAQSGIRGELLKLMLEDERERLKMQYEHETQVERNKHLGVMASTVKENVADGIQAIRMAAQEAQKAGVSSPAKPEEAPQSFACSCGMKFSAPAGWAGQPLKCPNPQCGREYTKEELMA